MADDEEKAPRPTPIGFEILRHDRAWEGELLLVDRYTVSYDLFGKELVRSEPRQFEICERGDAAAALLYDPAENKVILVNQFRLATAATLVHSVSTRGAFKSEAGDHSGGWLLETAAGTIRRKEKRASAPDHAGAEPAANEDYELPEDCIRRELREEVGYEVSNLTPITSFYASPGGSNERIHLFYAEVRVDERKYEGGGDETEDIEVVEVDLEEFLVKLLRQDYRDPKIIIAGYWLRDHLARRRAEKQGVTRTFSFRHATTGRQIDIFSGNIIDVKGVSVWVNPENTHMQMDRFFGRSVSAAIRWNGAKRRKTTRGEIVEKDIIADELRKKLDNRTFVELKTILETTAGALAVSNDVNRIYHIAIAEGFYEQGLRTDPGTLRECISLVLDRLETANRFKKSPDTSILFPMMGTGQGGLPVRMVAPVLIETAVDYLARTRHTRLQRICFNAFTIDDLTEALRVAADLCAAKILEPIEAGPAASG